MERAGPPDGRKLLLDLPDLLPDAAAVLLELLLARSPRPDAAAQPGQLLPSAREPPQPEGELRQLDLELSLPGARLWAKMSRMTSRRSSVFTPSSSSSSACCLA
jgi:hypothetical protein